MTVALCLLLLYFLYRLASLLVVAWEIMFSIRWENTNPLAVYCPKCGAYRGERCHGLREGHHVAREALVKNGRIES